MKKFWLVSLVFVSCRLLAAFVLPTFDDAFITYRYAYNLASKHELIYNTGERVMGTTAPLFALIATLPAFLSISLPRWFLVFNLLCDLTFMFLVCKHFFKGRVDGLFLLFAALFSLDPMVNRISIGGMEADLFLLVSLCGLILYLNGRKTVAAMILAAAYFLRPEAVILLFIVTVYELYTTRKIPVKQGLISLLVLAIPLTCIYLYYGQVLPQSVVAKNSMPRESFVTMLKKVFFPDPLYFLVFPLAVYGFISYYRKEAWYLLTGLWIGIYGLLYIVRAQPTWTWYFFSLDSLQLVFACLGVQALADKVKPGFRAMPVLRYGLVVLPLLIWLGVYFFEGRSGVEKNVYAELRSDFGNRGLQNKSAVFFADDIGAVGFFTGGYIYDDQKLVTPQAARYDNARDRILHLLPDYLFVYTSAYYVGLLRTDPVLSAKYRFVKRYAILGEKDFPADASSLTNDYKQDYLLFKRNP
jgi:hypothetical protein